jgi:hypothetical protein
MIVRDPPGEIGLEDVAKGLLVAVPLFDLDGPRDGVGLGKVLAQLPLQLFGVVRYCQPVEMFRSMMPIATLLVLVQADVGGSDEPRDAAS